jgi:hypothetical protein
MSMRAKFNLTKVTKHNETFEELEFNAVTNKPFDADGKSEDNDFARWTPTGNLKMSVTNPALIGSLKEGQTFYLDFTEVVE